MSPRWPRAERLVPLALLPALALAGAAAHAAAPVPRLEIVDRAIEYHGGERYVRSRSELRLCSASGCYEVSAERRGGLFDYRVAGPVSAGRRFVRWTNDSLEATLDGRPLEPTAEEAARLREWLMARLYFCFLPFRLNDPGVLKEEQASDPWSGRSLRRVKVTFVPDSSPGADDEFVYWLDPESGRVELYAYSFPENGGGLRLRRGFNYRRVGGLLFFDQENLGIDGAGLSVDMIDESFAARRMHPVSTVELRDVRVTPLPPPD